MWEDKILPAFEAAHPDIKVEFAPTDTNDYNAAIQSQIEGGTGPDLITCRPFDVNRAWIERRLLRRPDGLRASTNFDDTASAAWTGADDTPYCVPVASVLAGFYYNKAIFKELGLEVPTTQAEFIDVLQAIKDNGKYTPLAYGSADGWQLAYNVLYSIGPNYWKGEEGRLGLIDGTKKLTDPDFVDAFQAVRRPEAVPARRLRGAHLRRHDAAVHARQGGDPPRRFVGHQPGDLDRPRRRRVRAAGGRRPATSATCRRCPTWAIGLNAKSKNKDAAKTFLDWLATTRVPGALRQQAPRASSR